MKDWSLKQWVLVAMGVLIPALTIYSADQIGGNVDEGYYDVTQGMFSGKITVRNKPGFYFRNFAKLKTYDKSGKVYFSTKKEDKREGFTSQPIPVRFGEGGEALVTGMIKYRIIGEDGNQKALHRDYKSSEAIRLDIVRKTFVEAIQQSSSLFNAEETYSTKRSEYKKMIIGQARGGQYQTYYKESRETSIDGKKSITRRAFVKLDNNGNPMVLEESPLKKYGIEIIQFVLMDIIYDKAITTLIAKKKVAEQNIALAKSKAEEAKQNAVTEYEKGNALIAKAKAEQEVEKVKAITDAEKNYQVAILSKKTANENAKALLIKKAAEAEANKLLVEAGLTPKAKADIEMKTSIGVAAELAKVKFPQMMIIGGQGDSGPLDPFNAVGLKSFIEIQKGFLTGVK